MTTPNYLEKVFNENVSVIQEYESYEFDEATLEKASIEENYILDYDKAKTVITPSNLLFNVFNLGKIKVTSGKILACDPFDANDDEYVKPLNYTFPIGEFMCQLAIANIDNIEERVGFSRLKFSETEPVRWEIILAEGEEIDESDERVGYAVDSGTGGFMDISAQLEYKKRMDENEDYWEEIEKKMNRDSKLPCRALIWEFEQTNMGFFSSGYGDGRYPTYIGYDSNNQICRLVTDFIIIDSTATFT